MRIATYNVEWFNALFDDQSRPVVDGKWSSRYNITRKQQIDALGAVFKTLDADGVMIIEAPDQGAHRDTVLALERFAKLFKLRARKAVIGFANHTQQEIAFLYDPDVLDAEHDPKGNVEGLIAPRFDGTFQMDLDTDASPDPVTFSKPPLELALRHKKSGFAFRMIGVHAKSKAPHGARNDEEVMRISIDNRRKQMAQCVWLRQRADEHLEANDPLIILGDFNDGPGLDQYEKLFGRSGLEIVLGEGDVAQMYDPHARMALWQKAGARPATSRFYISKEKRYLQALLDYIMVSTDLHSKKPTWRIWHPFDDPECYGNEPLRSALLAASDHFPVTIDITF